MIGGLTAEYIFNMDFRELDYAIARYVTNEKGTPSLYSTDIKKAFNIVEKLTDLDLENKMRTFTLKRSLRWVDARGSYNPWGYIAIFGIRYDPRYYRKLEAWGNTASQAICRAALLAVTFDKEELK